MPINYTQSDTSWSPSDGGCSGGTVGQAIPRTCNDGGIAGSTPVSATVTASATEVNIFFKCIIAASTAWNSGTWTWRVNITTSNMNLTLDSIYICRLNSSGVNQETIGSSTGLGVSLGSTGVKSGTISGIETTPVVGDFIAIFGIVVNGAMTNQAFSATPDQNIDSPFGIANTGLLPFCISPQPTR